MLHFFFEMGFSSFSMDKMIFTSRPRWFLWGYPHKTTKNLEMGSDFDARLFLSSEKFF